MRKSPNNLFFLPVKIKITKYKKLVGNLKDAVNMRGLKQARNKYGLKIEKIDKGIKLNHKTWLK